MGSPDANRQYHGGRGEHTEEGRNYGEFRLVLAAQGFLGSDCGAAVQPSLKSALLPGRA